MTQNKSLCAAAVALALASGSAFATNGMNMDAYGPIAGGVGGASQAYDNGTAAMMNNPATLGLMADGSQLDVALGWLGPRVTSNAGGGAVDSDATSFLMPAFGYASKNGQLTWAGGVFAQGGMGTEYAAGSAMSLSGQTNRSEVGVGRAMLAAAYNVNDRLTIGGSADFVWAGMDLLMDAPASGLPSMITGISAGMNTNLNTALGMYTGGANPQYTYGRFAFSNSNDFTGKARGYGVGAKLGLAYKVNDMVSVGASYHSKTHISDLETDEASMTLGNEVDYAGMSMTIPGSIAVKDFQWPATFGVGVSITPSDRVQIAMDVKRIQWSKVMQSFNMTFTSGGEYVSVGMDQNWKDQTVVQGGVAYKVNNQLTVRGGFNFANNPIPNATVNPLFPATIEQHYNLGFGYQTSDAGMLNASFTYAPNVTVTGTGSMNSGTVIDHKQYSAQVMYSHRF